MWFALTVLLSNSVLGTPTPEDPPFYSDFLSENDFAENTLAFNDVETSSLIPLDFATQNLDFMDPTLLQPLEDPWLADDPASFPDDTRLLADSTDTFSETAPFFESSDPPSAKSCKIADRDDFKLYFKRNDGGICTTPTAETDPLPLLKLPDLDTLRKVLGSDQEEPTKRPANIIPPIPGYTPDDDNMCPRPWRRLCCQGPVYNAFSKSLLLVSDCRGMMTRPSISFTFPPPQLFF